MLVVLLELHRLKVLRQLQAWLQVWGEDVDLLDLELEVGEDLSFPKVEVVELV